MTDTVGREVLRGGVWHVVPPLLVGAVLRLVGLCSRSLWYDEGYYLHVAQRPIGDLLTKTVVGDPPAFSILTHALLPMARSPEFAARLPAAIMGVIGILAVFLLAREVLGTPVATLAAWITALAKFQLAYAREGRSFTFAFAFAALSSWALVLFLRRGTARFAVGYAMTLGALVFGNFFGAAVGVSQGAWATLAFLRSGRSGNGPTGRRWAVVLGILGVTAVLFALWLSAQETAIAVYEDSDAGHGGRKPSVVSTPIMVGYWLAAFINPVSQPTTKALVYASVGLGLAMVVLIVVWRRRRRVDGPPLLRLRNASVIPFLLVGPLAVLYVGDEMTQRSMFIGRYMIGASAGLYIAIAWFLTWAVRPRRRWVIGGVLLLSFVVLLPDHFSKPPREDWRGVGAWLEDNRAEGDVLVVSNSVMAHVLDHYFPDAADAPGLGRSASPETVNALADRLREAPRVILVTSHTYGTTIRRFLDRLEDHGRIAGPEIRFTAIRLRVIE